MPGKPVYTEVDGQRLKLTNLEKVLFPNNGSTKAGVIAYILEVAPTMLKYVQNRPLTLIRYPDGVGGKSFYTKNKPSWTPAWMPSTLLPWDDENKYLLSENSAHLIWLANLAALELHTMNSTMARIEYPDQIIIDLDPEEGSPISPVIDLAFELKVFLEKKGYSPFAKLSGGKGIHIVLPIYPKWKYEVVVETAKDMMREFIKTHPYTTLFVHKNKRKDKILLDIYRNHPGNTTIAPYSLRGKQEASVSMPLPWDEIANAKSARDYGMQEVLAYLKAFGDPWNGFYEQAADLHNQKKSSVPVSLEAYKEKRDFTKTSEPDPNTETGEKLVNGNFVLHLHDASRLHYDLRLGDAGVLKSWAIPKGLPLEKGVKRLAIQTEDHPAKYIDFEGSIPKEEYGGGQMWILDTGEFEWIEKSDKKLKFKLKGKSVASIFIMYRIKEAGQWLIERELVVETDLYEVGISPMLSEMGRGLPSHNQDYLFEIKWDGIRAVYYKNGDEGKLISRSGRDITSNFPEFKDPYFLEVQNAIIDCELVCLDDSGRPVFADIISRMHTQGRDSIGKAAKKNPAYLYAFDCLYIDGIIIMDQSLWRRQELLGAVLKTGNSVRLSDVFEDGKQLFEAAKLMGLEGIMAKKKDGKYYPGKRSDVWKKIKFRKEIQCHVIGYTKGKGDRVDLFGALHLAQKSEEGWIYLGKVGTGFDHDKMNEILDRISILQVTEKPIKEMIEEADRTIWIEAKYICEVTYASLSSNGTLREPVFRKLILDNEQ